MAPLRRLALTLLVLLAFATPARAVDSNEATGSPTHLTQLGGPGNDQISAFSGDMEISLPVGPTWELPGMSWGLSLHYSSKVWRETNNDPNGHPGAVNRRGAFGVGWLLTMGRVFYSCRDTCTLIDPLIFEDSRGTKHLIHLDENGRSGALVPGQTTDGTYMRVEVDLTSAGAPLSAANIARIRIYPGGGVVMIFDLHPADETANHPNLAGYPDDHYGWLMTRMERRGPDAATVFSWVNVTYEPTAALAHCIQKIEDGIGASGTVFRTINFTNASTKSKAGASPVTVEGGYTTQISMPGVIDQAPATAVYTLSYADPRTMSSPATGGFPSASFADQLFLSSVTLPAQAGFTGSYTQSFTYDSATGELTQQTFPTGGNTVYTYGSYSFTLGGTSTGGGVSTFTREVVRKDVHAGGDTSTWTYSHLRGNSSAPSWGIVKDSNGNQTKLLFFDQFDVTTNNFWIVGLTKEIQTYRGAPLNSGGGFIGPGRLVKDVVQSYANYGTPPVDDVRLITATTTLDGGRPSIVAHSNAVTYGRFLTTKEYGFESPLIPERTTTHAYDADPSPGSARWANWVTQALSSQTLTDRDGHVLRKSSFTYADDGRMLASRNHVDPNGTGTSDILATYSFDPASGDPNSVIVAGGDSAAAYTTRFYTDPNSHYVMKKENVRVAGNPQYFSFDVDRDRLTGQITKQRDPSGTETNLHYDILGRPTQITPPSPEMPTNVDYVGLKTTHTLKGPAGADRLESWTYLDDLGRPTESRKQKDATTVVSQFTCYDKMSRPSFVSEWRQPAGNETPGSPSCPGAANGGTTFSYSITEDDLVATDPLGRLHSLTAADGSLSETSYSGLDSTVTSHNINNLTTASTTFQRDAFGRLLYVDCDPSRYSDH